jgi:hypothetical protein
LAVGRSFFFGRSGVGVASGIGIDAAEGRVLRFAWAAAEPASSSTIIENPNRYLIQHESGRTVIHNKISR